MRTARIIMTALMALSVASPAFALNVKKSAKVAVSPAKAWSVVSDLCAIGSWHPSVASCELSQVDGVILRKLTLNPTGTIVEKFIRRDRLHQTMTYDLVSSPLPIEHYVSTMTVARSGKGSVITWEGNFMPQKGIPDDDATSWISDIYDDGLESFSKYLTGAKTSAQ